MQNKQTRYIFAGVGGMGMAPLASWLASADSHVVGYDDCLQPKVRTLLEDAGVVIADFLFEEDFHLCMKSSRNLYKILTDF